MQRSGSQSAPPHIEAKCAPPRPTVLHSPHEGPATEFASSPSRLKLQRTAAHCESRYTSKYTNQRTVHNMTTTNKTSAYSTPSPARWSSCRRPACVRLQRVHPPSSRRRRAVGSSLPKPTLPTSPVLPHRSHREQTARGVTRPQRDSPSADRTREEADKALGRGEGGGARCSGRPS